MPNDVPISRTLMAVAAAGPAARELYEFLSEFNEREGLVHLPIVSAATASGPPGQLPPIEVAGALSYLVFDGADGAQQAYRTMKIPASFINNPAFHIHWTKSNDLDRSGNTVRWRVSYIIFNGSSDDAAVAPTTIDFDDTYDDNGTTSRIVYRIPNQALVGVQPNYYIGVCVEKAAPAAGTPVPEPALVSIDFTYNAYQTRDSAP